jgi:hypothetical protein
MERSAGHAGRPIGAETEEPGMHDLLLLFVVDGDAIEEAVDA